MAVVYLLLVLAGFIEVCLIATRVALVTSCKLDFANSAF